MSTLSSSVEPPEPSGRPAAPNDQPTPGNLAPGQSRAALIYCGLCGALNPSNNYHCAACGATLVDAFHATEGLRVFERPDAASRLIEIVPGGRELEIVEDPDAPLDYARIRLASGRLGYIRLVEVEALRRTPAAVPLGAPDINLAARGCVGPGAALAALGLLIILGALGLILIARSNRSDAGVIALAFCLGVLPLMLLTIGLYLYARNRDEQIAAAAAAADAAAMEHPAEPA